MVDQAFTIAWYGARKYDEDATKRSLMHKLTHRAIAFMCTAALSVGLIGACTLREEGQKMEQCSGTIIDLPSAIWTPIIDGVPFLSVNGTGAKIVDGTPQADIHVYWDEGVNRPANLNETLKLGESATLEKVGTFTLIGMEPPRPRQALANAHRVLRTRSSAHGHRTPVRRRQRPLLPPR